MSFTAILLIALGLAMDAFAVSIATGLCLGRLTARHVFRMSFHFGLFQALMPIVGWAFGVAVATHISAWDHWIAFALLAYIGGKMLLDARSEAPRRKVADPTRGLSLVVLSVATSIDALAVGLSLALLSVPIWTPAAVIGVVAAVVSAIGLVFGSRLGQCWGRWAHLVGGIVLIGIGVRILVTHLTA